MIYKTITIIILLLLPNILFGNSVRPFEVNNVNTGMGFVALIYGFIFFIGIIMAIVFILQGLLKLIKNANNPNDPKNSIKSAFLAILAGAFLTNIHQSTNLMIHTITGGQTCFIGADASLSQEIKGNLNSSACFNADNSEITKSFKERLTADGTQNWEEFKKRIAIFFAVIQTIGLFYFIKSLALLKTAGDGGQNASYLKILVMMLFSAIAMDLNNFLTLIVNTYRAFTG